MQRVRAQHYVPQSYLRRFTPDGKLLWVFDKTTGSTFRSSVHNVAQENGFYDLPGDVGQTVERTLSLIEERFSEGVEALLGSLSLTSEIRHELADYIALQALRTRKTRDVVSALADKLAPATIDAADTPGLHCDFMTNPEAIRSLGGVLRGHIWVVCRNDTEQPFYTSDHPVTSYSAKDRRWMQGTGLAMPGVEVHFPLSPHIDILMLEPVYHHEQAMRDGHVEPVPLSMVTRANCLQVCGCTRQVFAPTECFNVAKQFLTDCPEACVVDRPRVRVE